MKALIPLEVIEQRILLIRGQRVMLSTHLAELYHVETRILNQAVKRNISRFPEDFMFQLDHVEAEKLVSQNVIPHKKYFGGTLPYAFTEQGDEPREPCSVSTKAGGDVFKLFDNIASKLFHHRTSQLKSKRHKCSGFLMGERQFEKRY